MNNNMDKLMYPTAAWMTVTRSCNYECKWCYAKEYCNSNEGMDVIRAKEVLDVLAKNNTKRIIFIGGEPTLYHDLNSLAAHAKSKGLKCALVTNGILLSDKDYSRSIVDSGITSCNISLKGTTEDEYVKNVGRNGLSRTIEGYNNMIECGCHTVLSFVISIPDTKKLSNLKDFLIHYGIPQISFLMEKPSFHSTKENTTDIFSLAKCCEVIYRLFEGTGIDYKIQLSIPFCAIEQSILKELIQRKRVYSCCHIMKGTGIVFDTEFNILPCNHFLGASMNDLPVSPNQIIEFWNNTDVVSFRERISCYPSEKCLNCEYWRNCGGGCFMRWMVFDPQETIPGL